MNKMSIDVSNLLYDNVVADDVLRVHRNINNFSIVSKEIVDLENDLMINSFPKTTSLFNSKYIYYRLSIVLKDMGLFMDLDQIENNFIYLLVKSRKYVYHYNALAAMQCLNKFYFNEFYKYHINKTVTEEDIIKVHKGISLNNQAFSDIILLEKRLLVSSLQQNKPIATNKLAYYKLAMLIKGLGLKISDQKQAEEVFNKILTYTESILNIEDMDNYTKINILDFIYYKLAQLNFNPMNKNLQQFNILNNEIKTLLKKSSKNINGKKLKRQLVYAIG